MKILPRQDSTGLDFLPFRGMRVDERSGLRASQEPRNPYLGICFGFDGLEGETLKARLNQRLLDCPSERMLLPDAVFNYKKGYYVGRFAKVAGGDGYGPVYGHIKYDTFGLVPTGSDTLPFFYLAVNVVLNATILRAADLKTYLDQVYIDAISKSDGSL